MPVAFRGLPRNVLLRVGPRLSEPGFRWAPSTLLHPEPVNIALWPYTRITSIPSEETSITSGPVFGLEGAMFSTLPHILPMLCSTLWNYLADFLFRMRDSLETAGWVPAMLQSPKRADLVTESASRGIPTSRGLLVRFAGYSLSMAHCLPGIPADAWGLDQQADGLYSRGTDGAWYMVNRQVPVERDSFLSSRSLRAIIREESNLWITHVESAFNHPEGVAEARDEQQVTAGLLVQLLCDEDDEDGIKYVQSKLHIHITLVRKSTKNLLEAAYQSAKQISRDVPANSSAGKSGGEQSKVNDVNTPEYKSNLELLEQEIHRAAIRCTNQEVTAAASDYSKNGLGLLQALIATMLVGGYSYLGPRTWDEQKWCVD